MRLGAPLRGVVFGLALVAGVPLAWSAGHTLAAIFVGGIAIFGICLEALNVRRKRS